MTMAHTFGPNATSVGIGVVQPAKVPPLIPLGVFIYYNVIRGLEAILTIIGNGLTILTIYRSPSLHTGPYYLITSLAVADFMTGLVWPVALVSDVTQGSHTWFVVCPLKELVYLLATAASIIGICAITIDRCIAVFLPLRYTTIMTTGRTKIVIAIVWFWSTTMAVVSIGIAIPTLTPDKFCVSSVIVPKPVFIGLLVSQCVAFSAATLVMYGAMATVACKVRRDARSMPTSLAWSIRRTLEWPTTR